MSGRSSVAGNDQEALAHSALTFVDKEALDLPLAAHGSVDYKELRSLGLRPDEVLDFSANVNPYSPPAGVKKALMGPALNHYPDRDCLELTAALTHFLGIDAARILPGNGASELIWLTALTFIGSSCRVLIVGPTYCEYARAALLMRAHVATWEARKQTGYLPEPKAIAAHLDSLRPHVVFLCNPNNPTGAVLQPDVIAAWARQYVGTLFVVDEAYLPFAPGLDSALEYPSENILVLRSMTKDFGLAGVRLGYAVGDERIIARLRRAQPPWSVNALAQAAGVAALRDPGYRQSSLERIAQSKEELVRALNDLRLTPLVSATHYFLLRVREGAAFRRCLLERRILVRDCASFGLPEYVRISTRSPDENAQLIAAIREALA